MAHATIEGLVRRVERRGKQLFCFEGTEIRKSGTGELISVPVGSTRYVGELVAIGPGRAIVFINPADASHGIHEFHAPTATA